MNSADFVVKVANPYSSLPINMEQPSENFLRRSIDYAVSRKVFPLFYEGCLKSGIRLPESANGLMDYYKRHRLMQIEAVKLLCDISDKYGLDLMYFKTFRPFNYVPDDVDILVRSEENLDLLFDALRHEGYFLLKVGTPEIGFRKVVKGAYVDLDIHKRLDVGSLELFNVESLWQQCAFEKFKVANGYTILKLSEDYEVVREAAYSLLKDFNVSVAGLYLGINAILNRDLSVIEDIAVKEAFLPHLKLYLGIVHSLAYGLFGLEAKIKLLCEKSTPAVLHLCKNLRTPYPYPLPVIAWAYITKTQLELQQNRNISVIPQIMQQPASKGINIFFDYLRELIH